MGAAREIQTLVLQPAYGISGKVHEGADDARVDGKVRLLHETPVHLVFRRLNSLATLCRAIGSKDAGGHGRRTTGSTSFFKNYNLFATCLGGGNRGSQPGPAPTNDKNVDIIN